MSGIQLLILEQRESMVAANVPLENLVVYVPSMLFSLVYEIPGLLVTDQGLVYLGCTIKEGELP